jgi:DNA-binding MarR family transcriptional regulator
MSSQNDFLKTMERWADIYMSQSLTEFFNYLKRSKLSMLQAYALTYIHYNAPCKISDLGEHMNVSAAATSQLVDRLEKLKMVNRIHEPEDRRVRNIALSSQGKKFVIQSIKARQSWSEEIPSMLSKQHRDQVMESLKILISLFDETND